MAGKTTKDAANKCRIITPEFRVSYPHLFKPQSIKGAPPKYSITMLVKKTAEKRTECGNLKPYRLAIREAKTLEWGQDESQWPKVDNPIGDGDSPKYADKEGYKGHWVVKATSIESVKPGLVDQNVEDILDAQGFYAGCYARAQIFASVWEFGGKEGVHFILDHVQKTREGKNLSGKKSAAEVFQPMTAGVTDDEESGAGADDEEEESGKAANADF